MELWRKEIALYETPSHVFKENRDLSLLTPPDFGDFVFQTSVYHENIMTIGTLP
jgi:hypothetical protein